MRFAERCRKKVARGNKKNDLYFFLTEEQMEKVLTQLQEFETENNNNKDFDKLNCMKVNLEVFTINLI